MDGSGDFKISESEYKGKSGLLNELKSRKGTSLFGKSMKEILTSDDDTCKRMWSDTQRKTLEEVLDSDLVSYMDTTKEGTSPLDQLEKELEKHPFFKRNLPQDDSSVPFLEGLQQLKLDPALKSPEEQAFSLKENGNVAYKAHNYKMAVMCYTAGITRQCSDKELNAVLYNNRAACHFFLKNYRSCYNDCKRALDIKPNYPKALSRLAHVCLELELYNECIVACDRILEKVTLNDSSSFKKELSELKDKARTKRNEQARDERKTQAIERKKEIEREAVVRAIKERGIQTQTSISSDVVKANIFSGLAKEVHLVKDCLVWPVIFLFPEFRTTDVVSEFHENSTFQQQLKVMLKKPPEWDKKKLYRVDNINLYYEDFDKKHHKVRLSATLKATLTRKSYSVDALVPSFVIFVKSSEAEYKFLNDTLPMI